MVTERTLFYAYLKQRFPDLDARLFTHNYLSDVCYAIESSALNRWLKSEHGQQWRKDMEY